MDEYVKSLYCDSNACVEVGMSTGVVHVRGGDGTSEIVFTTEEWDAFILGVKDGFFDTERLSKVKLGHG